ncbi:unnamed protein product [Sphagnum troendelagicum]|uniref:Uncharacterized protein n=1 Tax=Sphagnum troendelagicum TaxID=128251 RepID=A0ABP0TGP9_9BRYO
MCDMPLCDFVVSILSLCPELCKPSGSLSRSLWWKCITLRLAPPLRLEADGSGMPTEVWLKEDEISDVTLRLEPFQQSGGNSEQQ